MNKSEIIIGGVKAAKFKVTKLTRSSSKLNDIMLIAKEPDYIYKPDHMRRRTLRKRDFVFKYLLTKHITWRGFRIVKGRLDKIYLLGDDILDEHELLNTINL